MEQAIPFILFAFVASITPGPTNVLILSQSSRHGLIASLGLIIGACIGSAGIVWMAGFSLGHTLMQYPLIQTGMTWGGIFILSWLSWKIFTSPATVFSTEPLSTEQEKNDSAKLGFIGGAGLQLINPKTWMMAIAVIGVFLPNSLSNNGEQTYYVSFYSLLFCLVSLPCMVLWALLGCGAAKMISTEKQMRMFNQFMALLLLFSVWINLFL